MLSNFGAGGIRLHRRRPGFGVSVALIVAISSLLAGGCSRSSSTPTTRIGAEHSGAVDVLYAGSLVDLMQQQIAPAFKAATGYTLSGYSGESNALATDIKGGTQQGDVFISAAPKPNASLRGSANGNWISWYAEFATSPLVLGYNPNSRFAKALKSSPWYNVVSQPGFLVGRTDPATDPKGVLAVQALNSAATAHNKPALAAIANSSGDVFPETAMVGQLQAGQLDAGFFYAVEAAAAHFPTVPLSGTNLGGAYTITILNRAPHGPAAQAFVSFLLSSQGQKILEDNGLVPVKPPTVSGSKSAIPKSLQAAV